MDPSSSPLRVAVLVTLYWTPRAGGHVKTWERLADAAAEVPGLDLTVFLLGETEKVVERSPRARLHLLAPRFGTDRLAFLDSGAGHTDLARIHPRLAALLTGFDLVVTTDHFVFARTARRVLSGGPTVLVHSIHTDVETLARTYAPAIIQRLLGERLGAALDRWLNIGAWAARSEARKLRDHLGACQHVFVSRQEDADLVEDAHPGLPHSFLRRGLDLTLFSPARRDRAGLDQTLGLGSEGRGSERLLALFAGRADGSKRLMLAVEAVRRLRDQGHEIDLVIAGAGMDLPRAQAILGAHCHLLGLLAQTDLARVMASCDLFIFPSVSETLGNVVLEARASGLPVVLSGQRGGTGWLLNTPGVDGLVVSSDDPEVWAQAVASLLSPDVRHAMGHAAREAMEANAQTWARVLSEDLVGPWRALVGRA
ncbi:glycosyltransferase [Pararhodospirillum photometricum]|nr:glycosyltransferase [Pararhodospirillum photometricum]